ncbi:MAG: hypothetical protein V7677_18455 [Motiliproteus sp.]
MDSVQASDRQAPEGADVRRFELHIEHRTLKQGISKIVISHGDWIELRWHSNEPVEIHIHGYDIEQWIGSEAAAVTRFHAHATGRFPITAHRFGGPAQWGETDGRDHHPTLLYLEVHPQ